MVRDGNPHAGYNKNALRGTLVGNWVEERALEADTGIFRYEGWVPKDDPTDDSVYAKTATRAPFETHPRVVAHSARLESADWRASSRRQFQPPSARDEKLRSYVQTTGHHGARTAAALAAMEEEAARTYAEEDAPETKTHDFNAAFEATTTCATSFVEHDLAGAKIGARVMYTQDMTPIPPEACDNDFRAEAGYCDKSQIDAIRSKRAPGGGGHAYVPSLPHSIYAQKHEKGAYPNDNFFGTRDWTGAHGNPFTRNAEYSKDIRDVTKKQMYVD